MPVHCQCVIRADVPAVNRFKGTSSSKKVTQDHEIVRKIGKRADYQNEVSAIFTMRLENLCDVEPGYFKSRSWAGRTNMLSWGFATEGVCMRGGLMLRTVAVK